MAFRGWSTDALDFYEGLEADNSKTYWLANKAVYDERVHAPMTALIEELAPEFGGGKIFRPYRDVRFSADKSPYKTNIGAVLDAGGYIQLDAQGLAAGSGMYMMARDQLARYRQAVGADHTGRPLEAIIAKLARAKITAEGHDKLVRVPRGFAPDHPRAELLKYKGLIAWKRWPVEAWLGTPAAKKKLVEFMRAAHPLDEWLDNHVGPTTEER